MTKEEIIEVIHKTMYQFFDVCGDNEEVPMSDKDELLLSVNKAICNNIKALEQPCEDCISREVVLMEIDKYMCGVPFDEKGIDVVLKELPSVTPVRKKGKWINILPCTTNFKDQIIYQCVCDRCGSIAYFRRMCGKLVGAKYCPNCGAEMESE